MKSRNYTTIQGDAWDLIAYRMYGREHYMTQLIRANPSYRCITIFPAGVILKVPDVPDSEISGKNLPPWKRRELS